MVTVAKMCLRNNDQGPFRAPRLFHYIDLHKKYMGILPDDIHLHVRNLSDIPLVYKKEVMQILEEKGWTPREAIPTPSWIGTYPRQSCKQESHENSSVPSG
jgi:acetyl-CoA decarbonylase/synthase complex subunit alpha